MGGGEEAGLDLCIVLLLANSLRVFFSHSGRGNERERGRIPLIQGLEESRSDYRSCGRGSRNGRCLPGEETGKEEEVVVLFHCGIR